MTTHERIRLCPVQPGDLPRMYDLQLDPESNRMAVTIPRTREAFDSHWAKALADPGNTTRAVLVGEAMVGYISCFPMDGQDHVGYWIDRENWGMGIASQALQLLLREVAGLPQLSTWDYLLPGAAQWDVSANRYSTGAAAQDYSSSSNYDHHDWGRKYLKENGGCIYVDANHLEACQPEIRDAFDHVASWGATLDLLREIQAKANARLDSGRRIQVLVVQEWAKAIGGMARAF